MKSVGVTVYHCCGIFCNEIIAKSVRSRLIKTRSAVERQLVIIGEALNQLKKVEPNLEIENDKLIIGFRNRLVHAYNNIDNSIVWAILRRHIKKFKKEIQTIE